MKIVDLSHTIENNMPVYPGTEPPRIRELFTMEKDGFREKGLEIVTHLGTHIDAASHMFSGGKSLDQYSPEAFFGKAIKIDLRGYNEPLIRPEVLFEQVKEKERFDYLILQTGWEKYWGDKKYFDGFPVLSPETARWLTIMGLKGIGLDCISVDPVGAENMSIHHILLMAEMVIIENLTNLDALPETGFRISCMPLKIAGADGSPVRAYAIL